MLRSLLERWRGKRRSQGSPRPKWPRPLLEVLEDRCLLAGQVVYWTGGTGLFNSSDMKNWADAKGHFILPTKDDDIIFSAGTGVNWNHACTINMGQTLTVKSLTVKAGYTQKLTLLGNLNIAGLGAQPSSIADPMFEILGPGNLTLGDNTAFTMGAGSISNSGNLTLGTHSVFTMTGGAMKGTGKTIIVGDMDPTKVATLIFSGNDAKEIDGPSQTWAKSPGSAQATSSSSTAPNSTTRPRRSSPRRMQGQSSPRTSAGMPSTTSKGQRSIRWQMPPPRSQPSSSPTRVW